MQTVKSLSQLKAAFSNLDSISETLNIGWINDIYANTLNYKFLPTPEREERNRLTIKEKQLPNILVDMAENRSKYTNYNLEGSSTNWKKSIKKVFDKYFK
jgi:hypothetical protein